MVLGRAHDDETGFIKFFMETYSEGRDFARIRGGGTKHLPSDPDYTREMQLFEMNGKAIFKTVLSLGADGYEGFFDDNIAKEDYDVVIPHQVNAHGVSLYAKKGGFTEAQVFSNLARVGNMVSASLPVAFCDALERGRIRRGSRVCLLGTAAGITIGGLSLVY
jgi:3-oxoacyl-[acyl-carrier-protein] synthase-3